VIKTRTLFPNEEAAKKLIYLAIKKSHCRKHQNPIKGLDEKIKENQNAIQICECG